MIPQQFSAKSKSTKFSFLSIKNPGIQTQLNPDAESENEITIGLDFGTSSVKVVIRDLNGNTFLVPFGNMGVSTGNYLLPTRLYESNGKFSLTLGEQVWRDLKLSLMDNPQDESSQIRAVSFLALVLRHVRGWIFDNLSALYSSEYLIWGINIRLPAKSYDNKHLVETFRKVGIAAANASADKTKSITTHLAKVYLRWSASELNALKKGQQPRDMPFMADMIEVVPEIAAQISGYVRSGSWDRKSTMMMLVDIGAGTVDASVFTVVKAAQYQFAFLSASVTPHGVMNLHRWRVQWLKKGVESINGAKPFVKYLDEICLPTDQLQGIPESWRDYIPGLQYNPYSDVDKQFYAEYRSQLFDKTIRQGKTLNPLTPEWQGLPIFLCGGGKSMEIYKQFIGKVNNEQSGSRIRLVPKIMPKPANLLARGVKEQDYHRFSVAYGLSYSRDLIGKCIPTAKIPPFTRSKVVRKRSVSITKEMI